MTRLLWLLADYGCRALIHIIDAAVQKTSGQEGG